MQKKLKKLYINKEKEIFYKYPLKNRRNMYIMDKSMFKIVR